MFNINPVECYLTEDFQYVLIHKNGCQMIRSTIEMNYNEVIYEESVDQNLPSFVVIRDPWERTISGLTYDLQRTFGYVNDQILNSIDFYRIFHQPINKKQRITGYISHVNLQSLYLFDINPTFYVMLNDLSPFLSMHFNEVAFDEKNESNMEFKNSLIQILNRREDITDIIRKYLAIDYYILDRIKNNAIVWDFTMGKMW